MSERKKSSLPTNTIDSFLELQSAEIELEHKRHELNIKNEEHTYQHAMRGLEYQNEALKRNSETYNKAINKGFYLVIILIVAMVAMFAISMYTDNTQLIGDILRFFAYVTPSLLAGYFAGFNKGKKAAENMDSY